MNDLDREQKLKIVKNFKTFGNFNLSLTTLEPNEHGDWLSMRNSAFDDFIPIVPKRSSIQKNSKFIHCKRCWYCDRKGCLVFKFFKG